MNVTHKSICAQGRGLQTLRRGNGWQLRMLLQDLRERGVLWASVHELFAEELVVLTRVPSTLAYHILSCCRLRGEVHGRRQAPHMDHNADSRSEELQQHAVYSTHKCAGVDINYRELCRMARVSSEMSATLTGRSLTCSTRVWGVATRQVRCRGYTRCRASCAPSPASPAQTGRR